MMGTKEILRELEKVAEDFAAQRQERQQRRELDEADFERIADAGFLLSGVPQEAGGVWQDVAHSTRPISEMLRTLAHGDSSVALVSAMHPAVISFWLACPDAPPEYQDAWNKQSAWIAKTAKDGAWWGTITSEPGSGGDIARTRSVATPQNAAHEYTLTGQKHFGSGSGIVHYMITTALPEGTDTPEIFFMDVRNVPWDGSAGMELIAPWDGHGMIATQSHGMRFEEYPVTRSAWPGSIPELGKAANPFIACLFTAVIVGVVESALEAGREQVQRRSDSLRAYEQVEWTRVETEAWLMQQAHEGMLRAVEKCEDSGRATLMGKTAVAELAESVTRRLCRVFGGGTYSRHNRFGFWFEDVRALGFLRPPWGLAYDNLLTSSMESLE